MIFVVEDDHGVRELELYALRQSGYEAEGFETPAAFRQALEKTVPDCVLLDVMLPGEDGLSLLRFLRRDARTRRVPVILVTARDAEMDKVKGLDCGADDYLTKPFGVMELLARVRALLRRTQEETPSAVMTLGDVTLDRESHRVTAGGQEIALTHMEFELLAFLMAHAGKAVTREVLLDDVWGIAYSGDTRTIDVHVRTLRQKLGDSGRLIAATSATAWTNIRKQVNPDEKPPFFPSAADAVGRNPADPSADVRAGIRGHVLPNDRRQPRAAPAAGHAAVRLP